MPTTTTVIKGRPRDGETSAVAGSFAKRLNDLVTSANTFNFAITTVGSNVVAVVVTT